VLQADKIATLVKAAGVQVEGYWPSLFAKLCEKRSVEDLITNVGGGKWRNLFSEEGFRSHLHGFTSNILALL
jgi:hypothetical protein